MITFNEFQRANPFGEVSNNQIENQLKLISEEFLEDWLNQHGKHPLQILWKRKDQVSTLELYTFARAIEKLKAIDKNWLHHQKKIILQDNVNNRKGAFWEIIGAYYLMDPENDVIPVSQSQKGFDLISRIKKTGKEIKYSLKNYSFSHHHNTFASKAESIAKLFKKTIIEKKIHSIQILIAKIDNYPSEEDWNILDIVIEDFLSKLKKDKIDLGINFRGWLIGYYKLPDAVEEYKLSDKLNSYTLLMHVPFHKNERNNLLSNLEDAVSNLRKANIVEDKNNINTLFIHIPTTASIEQCQDWVFQYYGQIGRNPVTNLILYQPSINFDFKTKITYLQHCLRITQNADTFDPWFDNNIKNKLEFWFETGIFNQVPFQQMFIIDSKEYNIENTYTYQTGDIFVEPKVIDEQKLFARFGKYTGGIRIHTVYKDKVITTPLEPNDELLIL